MAVLIESMRAIIRRAALGWSRVVFALGLVLAFGFTPATGAREDTEYQVKAAFLLNFARFVEWPSSAFASPSAPLTIGILGDDPFGAVLDKLIVGKTVENHPLVLKRVTDVDAAVGCQLLFICESQKAQTADILQRLQGKPVLTVSDVERFTEAGGMICLKRRQDMIRFDINLHAAESNGLKISSRLFKLADNLRDKH
jgi:hypothetical protein